MHKKEWENIILLLKNSKKVLKKKTMNYIFDINKMSDKIVTEYLFFWDGSEIKKKTTTKNGLVVVVVVIVVVVVVVVVSRITLIIANTTITYNTNSTTTTLAANIDDDKQGWEEIN